MRPRALTRKYPPGRVRVYGRSTASLSWKSRASQHYGRVVGKPESADADMHFAFGQISITLRSN
jgi:hypothetical protein